ncbi:GRAS family protein [Selaginella moellendorffii]|uniref:GRAS family protein n=1 Tax=Selaginella moellendorffii TaxID=88036 RepID=D8QYZ4_SELML|nr:scarecrow-like protein 14 [Selaginella moellendorffii]EFJ34328.1 GRAS family protein [Selaginella moellendorffii]|eukprot:XP_002963995.1 scarecrow-like protein 14 [Selaginella moellendorffii]
MEAAGEDLVSQLRRVLYRHQVELEPAANIGYSRRDALHDSRDTLAYLSKMLLEDEGEGEADSAQQQKPSFQGLFDELSAIVSPSESSDGSTEGSDQSSGLEVNLGRTTDIYSSLMVCARAVAANNVAGFYDLARDIRDAVALQSTPLQKVARFLIDALAARLAGTGPQAYRAISAGISSRMLVADARLPLFAVAVNFANNVILRACAGANKVHIIDYGVHCGRQWPSLIKAFSVRPEGPPQLKITGIDLVTVPEAFVAGQRLAAFARSNGVQLEYCSIQSNSWESVQPVTLANELLVVNSNMSLKRMRDEWISVNNPRRLLFESIYKMRPKVFVMCVSNASFSSPFFIPKFDETLKHFTAKMECLDAWLGWDSIGDRDLIEKVFQRAIMSVVACDGLEQLERPDKYRTWDSRAKRAGFQPFLIGEEVYERMKSQWGGYACKKNFGCGKDENWMLLGWKDVILCGMSAWQTKAQSLIKF